MSDNIPERPSLWLKGEIEQSDDGKGPSVVIASTAQIDRDNDILEQDWNLDEFKKNPVIQWAHNYSLPPVGRAVAVEVKDGKLLASIEWDESEDNPLGRLVARQVREKFINAVSVGFCPGSSMARRNLPKEDPRYSESWGYIHSRNSLLEISPVPIPSNPGALFVTRGAQDYDAKTVIDCMQRGLPAPGQTGQVIEYVRAELRKEMGAKAVEALLADEDAMGRLLEALRPKAAPEPEKPADPWGGWFGAKAAPEDGAKAIGEWWARLEG